MQGIAHIAIDFTVQVLAGIVGVFVGVYFALVSERRRREQDALEREAEQMQGFDRAVDSVLGSVVKNTAEAKRILRVLASRKGTLLVHAELESSVWFATQAQFIALCPNVDQRVIVAQFFDEVRRLQAFSDFRSNILVRRITAPLQEDNGELVALVADVDRHLADLAEDVRMCGMMLINDHGKPVHKRLIGIRTAVPT
ncbi:MAG: hypothetical protein ABIP16_00870 [Thermomonas sp.]